MNDAGAQLTFGEHAATNVMRIGSGVFYPVTDVTNPVIGVL